MVVAALQLIAVSKSYGSGPSRIDALQSVDVLVKPGEMVAVMGPSGSGKSTLLTIAGGLEQPTEGQVLVGGVNLNGVSAKERSRLRRQAIGYVFQDFNLLAGLTAIENVALPLELDGQSTRSARAVAEQALDKLGLADRSEHYPDELSGGERQRVAIARGLVGSRFLLLADEPTGALDSVNGEAVMRILRNACDEGTAVVLVTHDAHLASWADRVLFLRDGRLVDETPDHASGRSLVAKGLSE